MSTLKTGALRGTSGTADSVQLHASNQSVTFPGAVTFGSTTTGITTGYTLLTDNQSVGTGTSYTITSIPAANHIKIIHAALSWDGNSAPMFRVGTTSGIKTADYFSSMLVIQGSNATDSYSTTSRFQLYGANESGKAYMGMIDLWRMGTGNNYHMHWCCTSSQNTGDPGAKLHWSHGFVEAGGTIDRIEFSGEGGDNFDSGSVSLYHI